MNEKIRLSIKEMDIFTNLSSGFDYVKWLRMKGEKENIHSAAKFLLNSVGDWNSSYNQWILNHHDKFKQIASGADIVVIHKTVEIYTINYSKDERARLI